MPLCISPFNIDCQVGSGVRIGIVAFCAGSIGVKFDRFCNSIIEFQTKNQALGYLNALAFFLPGTGVAGNFFCSDGVGLKTKHPIIVHQVRHMKNLPEFCIILQDGCIIIALFTILSFNTLQTRYKAGSTDKCRTFTVPLFIQQYIENYCLRHHIKPTDIIFPITERAVKKQLAIVCDYLGYEGISTHSFHKWYATEINKNSSYDMALVQRLLQHSSAATTQRYIGMEPQKIEDPIPASNRMFYQAIKSTLNSALDRV